MGRSIFEELNAYNAVGQYTQPQVNYSVNLQSMNPMQKLAYVIEAMRNPRAFAKQHIPDIPDNISNNPSQILQFLQSKYGITTQQIQEAQNAANQIQGIGFVK